MSDDNRSSVSASLKTTVIGSPMIGQHDPDGSAHYSTSTGGGGGVGIDNNNERHDLMKQEESVQQDGATPAGVDHNPNGEDVEPKRRLSHDDDDGDHDDVPLDEEEQRKEDERKEMMKLLDVNTRSSEDEVENDKIDNNNDNDHGNRQSEQHGERKGKHRDSNNDEDDGDDDDDDDGESHGESEKDSSTDDESSYERERRRRRRRRRRKEEEKKRKKRHKNGKRKEQENKIRRKRRRDDSDDYSSSSSSSSSEESLKREEEGYKGGDAKNDEEERSKKPNGKDRLRRSSRRSKKSHHRKSKERKKSTNDSFADGIIETKNGDAEGDSEDSEATFDSDNTDQLLLAVLKRRLSGNSKKKRKFAKLIRHDEKQFNATKKKNPTAVIDSSACHDADYIHQKSSINASMEMGLSTAVLRLPQPKTDVLGDVSQQITDDNQTKKSSVETGNFFPESLLPPKDDDMIQQHRKRFLHRITNDSENIGSTTNFMSEEKWKKRVFVCANWFLPNGKPNSDYRSVNHGSFERYSGAHYYVSYVKMPDGSNVATLRSRKTNKIFLPYTKIFDVLYNYHIRFGHLQVMRTYKQVKIDYGNITKRMARHFVETHVSKTENPKLSLEQKEKESEENNDVKEV